MVECTDDNECASPSWIRVPSRCVDNNCQCTEPLFGNACEKDLTDEYPEAFLTFAYTAALMHLFLFVVGVRNLWHHVATQRDCSFSFSVRITSLMMLCNVLSAGFYAKWSQSSSSSPPLTRRILVHAGLLVGLNFGAEFMLPVAPWSVYYFFEGGACSVWGIAIAEIVRYWLEVFAASRATWLLSTRTKLLFLLPMALFVFFCIVMLVLLMVGVVGYPTWVYTFVGVESVLTLMLLVASKQILTVIRQMHGTGEKVAVTTLNLMVILVLYICYDVLYVLFTSKVGEVGPRVFLAVESLQALLWLFTMVIVMEVGFKGLSDPPWRLRGVEAVNAWTARRLITTEERPKSITSMPTSPASSTDVNNPTDVNAVYNPTMKYAEGDAPTPPELSPGFVARDSPQVGGRIRRGWPSAASETGGSMHSAASGGSVCSVASGGSVYSVAEDTIHTEPQGPRPDSELIDNTL